MARPVSVIGVDRPTATGFSADTMLLTIGVEADGGPATERLVIQAAPRGPALFADYDLARTFRVQNALADFDVPVATMRWLCENESWIGSPFYVMDLVEGRVPPDRPPYHRAGWLFDALAEERRTIWCAGIEAMADLHRVPIDDFGFLAEDDQSDPATQRIDRWRRFGVELGPDAEPLLLDALDHLAARRPEPGELRVHWGDAKLGNMIFHEGRTAAILDWELCGLGVPEEDLAHWMAVDWFLSAGIGQPRLDALPGPGETIEVHEAATGRPATRVDWWFAFALVRMGLIFQRAAVQTRTRSGSDTLRPNPIVPHLGRILDGTTWARYERADTSRS